VTVRDRAFRRYDGPITARRWRFLILFRYSWKQVFSSRLVTALYALSFAPLLVAATLVYLRHNVPALDAMEIDVSEIVKIEGAFFNAMLRIQGFLLFALTALVGPGLVSPDLANNGLPLYLCRPFSRTEYVLGKLSVLALLGSTVTWIPLLLVFVFQSSLETGWLAGHWHLAGAVFVGSWAWILVLALLALALSAWVRWRLLAAAMMFAFIFVSTGFGEFVNELFRTDYGDLLSPGKLIFVVWNAMIYGSDAPLVNVSPVAAWFGLAGFCAFCLLILNRKLRAYEVVR
jgi:ABC-2 type transport system permease protein